MSSPTKLDEIDALILGICDKDLPSSVFIGAKISQMMSATDEELQTWLKSTESSRTEDLFKRCSSGRSSVLRRPVEWGPLGSQSKYKLFESHQEHTDESKENFLDYIYLRGYRQRTYQYVTEGRVQTPVLTHIPEIHEIWLIATNRSVRLSFNTTLEDQLNSLDIDGDKECKEGNTLLSYFVFVRVQHSIRKIEWYTCT